MAFCCTADVVSRRLTEPSTVRFPDARKKLLQLMAEDQRDRSNPDFFSSDEAIASKIQRREAQRADQALNILRQIKTPSAKNIGLDGSRAVWLIALHNPSHQGLGEIVLRKMRRLYYKDKTQVFYPGIPYLVDRLMLLKKSYDHSAKQLYGTQMWYVRNDNGTTESGLFDVIDPEGLVSRRSKFCLASNRGKRCRHQHA